jgi:6-phosphogluconolactonase
MILASMAPLTTALPKDALRLYIGTYTKPGGSSGIQTLTMDPATGALGGVQLAAGAHHPSYLAVSPDKRCVYAAMETADGAVGAFLRKEDGTLEKLNEAPSGGAAPCHVSLDPSGRVLLVANYNGGSIASFRIAADGSIGERAALVKFEGSGPDPRRQAGPHAHSAWTDAAGKTVYACDLGTDSIWIFQLDAATGMLAPAEPPAAKTPPGGGPRHLAIHPNGRFAYANNEMGMSVTAFAMDAQGGTPMELQTVPTCAPGKDRPEGSTAAIFCHPSGKWLYVSSRGPDTISTYAIRQDGRLEWIEEAPSGVKTPRGIGIDPAGKWLVAAGQSDNRIVVLRIDPATGRLSPTQHTAEIPVPVCVVFAP